MEKRRWTHRSVVGLAPDGDPLAVILERSRSLVLSAMEMGWSGPPFDPIQLADLHCIPVVPRDDIPDARTVPTGTEGKVRIEFNPTRPRGRMRYSIAHEIGHTLFPDCAERVRNRVSHCHATSEDWELEMLCNIAAAEIIMPIGSFHELGWEDASIDRALMLRREFDVSTEAMLIRLTRLSDSPLATVCVSRLENGPNEGRYRVNYALASPGSGVSVSPGQLLPESTLIEECVAIGYTSKGIEDWGDVTPWGPVEVECVGIPPYPGNVFPRVACLVQPATAPSNQPSLNRIQYLQGSAIEPRGMDHRIIAHLVNDATPNWGGNGLASALRRKWPVVQDEFRQWAQEAGQFTLGGAHCTQAERGISVFTMIAQHGYGASTRPRVRYEALASCLMRLGEEAISLGASVHIPRVGCGQAGGDWEVVEELLKIALLSRGVRVTVYDLPGTKVAIRAARKARPRNLTLF